MKLSVKQKKQKTKKQLLQEKQEKIKKLQLQQSKALQNRLANETLKQKQRLEEEKSKLQESYQKRIEAKLNKIIREYNKSFIRAKKKLLWQEVKPKKIKVSKIKQRAYTMCQYWRKISLADKDGMVKLADKWTPVKRNDCVAGHVYSKSGNGHMAFLEKNIRPITSRTNQEQWTSPWIYRAKNVLSVIDLNILEAKNKDKKMKNEIRDTNYYIEQYEKFSELAKKHEQRLGIIRNKRL